MAASMVMPRPLRNMMATLFLELFGSSLTLPVFTYFCITELRLTAEYVGFVMSMFSAAQLLGAPIVGRLSDACGRRSALLACFLWTSMCFIATATVRTFMGLVLVRTIAGLSGGSIPVCQAMVMDVTSAEQRPSALGTMGGLIGTAFTLGPGVVTAVIFAVHVQRRWVFVSAGLSALVGFAVGLFVLQETLPPSRRRTLTGADPESGTGDAGGRCGGWLSLLDDTWACCTPSLLCVWGGRFCSSFACICFFSTYAFLIRDAFHWGDREFGLVLASGGLLGALIQFAGYPALVQALGKHTTFVVGASLVTMYFTLLPMVTLEYRSTVPHLCLKVLFICGMGVMDPGIPDLVAAHSPEDRMGLVQGLTNAFRSLAAVAAPLVAGHVYDISPFAVYRLAAAFVALGGFCVALAPILESPACGVPGLALSPWERFALKVAGGGAAYGTITPALSK